MYNRNIHQVNNCLWVIFFFVISIKTGYGQTISNGSFEFWSSNCPYNVAPTSWTNFSTSLGPDKAGTCVGNVTSMQGNSHMNLVWVNTGLREGAKQNIPGLTPGQNYDVTFYAINDQGLWSTQGSVILDFYHNGNILFSTPELLSGGAWTLYNVSFTAQSIEDTIGFRITPGSVGTSGSVGVDSVTFINLATPNKEIPVDQFSIYPNSMSSVTTITFANEQKNTMVKITDLLGKEIKSILFSGKQLEIEKGEMKAGIYFVQVIDERKNIMNKQIVVK